ncbi:fructose-bisphosphate aldolase, cytoplasmic isozyme-like [Agrilus planipennis]|uniref:fructose-bisphosphate aldolase n=1 Tax=Agrilus planipennis TaxID=224129 RepID=A0A1W4X9S9_AGRPL|nr:fructose-bisphosphate aldolase, cytoplasmic isozyme-like [Agrilus planipennis]
MPKQSKDKVAAAPKKDPLTAMNEMIQEKLEKTRACLSCLQNQLKQKEMQEKMGMAVITRVMNPDEPEMVSFSYPNQAILELLMSTAKSLATPGKGIFTMDEFVNKKLEILDCLDLHYVDLEEDDKLRTTRISSDLILKGCVNPWAERQTLEGTDNNNEIEMNEEQTEEEEENVILEKKRRYVELLLNTENLGSVMSGILLTNSEVLQMKTDDGKSLADIIQFKDLIVGTTLDLDSEVSSLGECTLLGLDNLASRIIEKRMEGFQFLEVKCPIEISPRHPSPQTINENCRVLGRFSNICQANRMLPILNLDIFASKNESLELAQKKTESILVAVCKNLLDNYVVLEGILLKLHVINPGPDYTEPTTPRQIAMSTTVTLTRSIPPAIPGIIFDPNKYEEEDFLIVFNEANRRKGKVPWTLSFMYGTFGEDSVLKAWQGDENNVENAQKVFYSKIDAYQRAASGSFQLEGGLPVDCKKYFF